MPYRERLPDETDQQHSFRRVLFLASEAYLRPLEVKNESGDVVAVLQPGEGIFDYTFNRLLEALNHAKKLVENPAGGTLSTVPFSPLNFMAGNCFDVNPATESASLVASAQYLIWGCNDYFGELIHAMDVLEAALNDARFERTAYVDSLSPTTNDWVFRDDGNSVTLDELLGADIDRQENIEAEREDVRSAATETPTWLPFAAAGLLGYFLLRGVRA